MNASILLFTILLSDITSIFGIPETTPSSLTVTVTNLQNNHGMVCVSPFGKDGIPKVCAKSLRTEYVAILSGTSTVTFTDGPASEYAVSVFHDENDNKKLDTNILGIPNEGVESPNHAKGHFGPLDRMSQSLIFLEMGKA